jgi:D-glycerate 3-kinase
MEEIYEAWHRPFADTLARWRAASDRPIAVGLQGCQGAGKSTLCALLPRLAADLHGLRIAVLALDDIYLPHADRERLTLEEHPLWITRGVPGTHDPILGAMLLERLRNAQPGEQVSIPTFDKGIDDRLPQERWDSLEGPFDVVIFEGWCVGLRADDIADWTTPVNALERDEDPDEKWRARIRRLLAGPYANLFGLLDRLAVMLVPSWETVALWRGEQEAKLRDSRGEAAPRSMSEAELSRFLAHYERLTRAAITVLPERADVVARIGEDRSVRAVEER